MRVFIPVSVIVFFFGNFLFAQKQASVSYEKLEIVYIENSRRTGDEEGLTEEQADELLVLLEKLETAKNTKFLLYLSDGQEPILIDEASGLKGFYKTLSSRNQQLPSFAFDYQEINKWLDEHPLRSKQAIFHFFCTPYFLDRIQREESLNVQSLLSYFPLAYGVDLEVKFHLSKGMNSDNVLIERLSNNSFISPIINSIPKK